ncbi:MAG: hypothetical protein AAF982_07790, partial [Pseudomonadota bacterium]
SGDVDWNTAEPSRLLQVFVGKREHCCVGRTPIAGKYRRSGDQLSFAPSFGFTLGQDYVVRLHGSSEKLLSFLIESDAPVVPAAVTAIYPSGETLPENTLRFYIHFSAPMQPHVAFEYIGLQNAEGAVDDAAFMKFKQELWNEDRTRLTVLVDPGRIKRGVATNLELGPALLAGQDYALTIAPGWPSADGRTVTAGFSKPFNVSAPLRSRLDTALWDVSVPSLGGFDVLRITFDRPFDHQLLQKDIRVITPDGKAVGGDIEIGEDETTWEFQPSAPWQDRQLMLIVRGTLEDVAGNNFQDLLDHAVGTTLADIPFVRLPITLQQK